MFGLLPGHAAAQDTFENLAGKIREGQKIIVRDATGAETRGTVQSVGASLLVVKYGQGRVDDPANPGRQLNDTRSFAPSEVRQVLKPGPIWDGAIKGALVGLIPAAIAAGADCYDCGVAEFSAFTIAVGAGIGLGIDAAWGPKTVYRNRAAVRKVTLAPIVGKDRRGFAASIRF